MTNSKEAQTSDDILDGAMSIRVKPQWGGHGFSAHLLKYCVKAGLFDVPARGSFALWAPWIFCLGVATYFFPLHEPNPALPVFIIALSLTLGWVLRRFDHAGAVWLVFVLALLAAFSFGWAAAQWRSHTRAGPVLSDQSRVYKGEGLVLAVDKERGHRARYLIAPDALGRLAAAQIPKRIRISGFINDAEPGQRVRFTAALQAPASPLFPGAYNFARSAWFQRIGGTGFSYGHIHVDASRTVQHGGFQLALAKIRRSMAQAIRTDLGGQKGAVAAALVTGDRSAISEQTADDLRASGLAHMLAISGLHMGLVAGLVFGLGGMILAAIPSIGRRFDARKPAAVIGLLVAIGYLLLSGGSAPTQRAFVMTAVVLSAVLFDRRALSIRTISLAALVVAALSPENVISPGFQMSFSAALALIAFYEWAGPRVRVLPRAVGLSPLAWVSRLAAVLGALALTSLIAGLATGPFAAFYFHRTAVYGLAANIAAMPVFTFIVMPSLLAGTLLDFVGMGAPFFVLAGWGLDVIINIAHFTAQTPGAILHIPAAPATVRGIITIGLLMLALLRKARRIWGALLMAVGFALWANVDVPDGLITPEGGAVRVATKEKDVLIGYGDMSGFVLEQFASALAMEPDDAMPLKKAGTTLPCDVSGCVTNLHDERVLVFNQLLGQLAEDCRQADIVVTTFRPSARNAAYCPKTTLITPPKPADESELLFLYPQVRLETQPASKRPWSAGTQTQ